MSPFMSHAHFTPRILLVAICLTMLAQIGTLVAQDNPDITLFEDGTGMLVFPGGGTFSSPGVLQSDPGPGGQASALTFNLLGPPALVAGDVALIDAGTFTLSDLIRFNPAGTGSSGYPASVVYYSMTPGLQLADTGGPSAFYSNTLFLAEGPSGVTTYTPTSTEPGFVSGFSVSYILRESAVPEPSSLALLGLGAASFLIAVRSRATRSRGSRQPLQRT